MKKVFALAFASLMLVGCGGRDAQPFDYLAQCLTDKGAKMYGADTCPHCQAQKKGFKGSFDLITYVECNSDPIGCEEAEIAAYPTWEINGEKYEGRKSLSELAELSGCSIRPEEDSSEEADPVADEAPAEDSAEAADSEA